MAVKHALTSSLSDRGNASLVQPSNWNADHTIDSNTITEAQLSIADNTTKDVTTSAHGFVPKAPNDNKSVLLWDGTWGTPNLHTATLANDASTGANTTPISLTGMAFTYEANSKYLIQIYGAVSAAAATTGCGFQIDVSSAVTSVWLQFFHQLANTGTLSGGNSIADDTSQGVSSGIPANGGVYPMSGFGILITAGNTGTAQLRFRSETTAATTCKAGTTWVVQKIA